MFENAPPAQAAAAAAQAPVAATPEASPAPAAVPAAGASGGGSPAAMNALFGHLADNAPVARLAPSQAKVITMS